MIEHASGGGTVIAFGLASSELHAARVARLQNTPSRVVLVDPTLDPEASPAHLLAGTEGTTLIDALPGPTQGEAEFLVWSVRGLTGLQQPTPALMDLFPGLRCKSRRMVPMRSIADLTESLRDLPAPLTVWIDLPGAEGRILDALLATELARQIQTIWVRSTVEPFFEGGSATSDLVAKLAAQGFNLTGQDDTDPDFPDLDFEIDHQTLTVGTLEGELRTRHDSALEMSQKLTELEAEFRALAAERDALQSRQDEIETQRDEVRSLARRLAASESEIMARDRRLAELEAQLKATAAERDAARETITSEIEARDARLAELEAQLKEATEAHEHATSEIEARDARLVELEAQLKDATEAHDAARKHADSEIKARDSELEEERRKSAEKLANAQAATRADTEKLEGQVRELKQRLSLAQNELRRAEGQMELIKDLLLRETSL